MNNRKRNKNNNWKINK